MKLDSIDYFLVDIDGTITDYKPGAMKSETKLAGNFLFPIIRDMMVEDGWDHDEASIAMSDESQHNVYWDYCDFTSKFNVCEKEAFDRIRQ